MCVKKVAGRGAQKHAQLQDSIRMAKVMAWKRKAREILPPRTCFQFAPFRANNDLAVASLSNALRKFQQLALAAAQTQGCVNMRDLEGSRGSHR
jgi:hypothetical protein